MALAQGPWISGLRIRVAASCAGHGHGVERLLHRQAGALPRHRLPAPLAGLSRTPLSGNGAKARSRTGERNGGGGLLHPPCEGPCRIPERPVDRFNTVLNIEIVIIE